MIGVENLDEVVRTKESWQGDVAPCVDHLALLAVFFFHCQCTRWQHRAHGGSNRSCHKVPPAQFAHKCPLFLPPADRFLKTWLVSPPGCARSISLAVSLLRRNWRWTCNTKPAKYQNSKVDKALRRIVQAIGQEIGR